MITKNPLGSVSTHLKTASNPGGEAVRTVRTVEWLPYFTASPQGKELEGG